jgi:hypothetical protein
MKSFIELIATIDRLEAQSTNLRTKLYEEHDNFIRSDWQVFAGSPNEAMTVKRAWHEKISPKCVVCKLLAETSGVRE